MLRAFAGTTGLIVFVCTIILFYTETYASINVKPEGRIPGICGAFDFSEEFLVKIPTVGSQNFVKSDQIYPP